MKIVFFEIEEWEKPYLQEKFPDHEILFFLEHVTEENVSSVKDADVLSIFINSQMTRDILSQFPNLKMVTTRSTGYDHIDLEYCKEKNITVCNVPEYGSHTVAEHTFALILALSRKIVPAVERTQKGNFDLDGLRGFDLYGKTLGIIGVGNIGTNVIKIAQGFGMHVVAFSRHPSEADAKSLGITFLELKELFGVSDIVSLHVPYTKETHHLINKKNINKFKKGSILINTARGGLVETEALLLALEKGILSSAGIDVLEEEYDIKEERELLTTEFLKKNDLKTQLLNHVLLNRENVMVTPHNAFNSHEALQRILDVTIDNILHFQTHKVQNVIEKGS